MRSSFRALMLAMFWLQYLDSLRAIALARFFENPAVLLTIRCERVKQFLLTDGHPDVCIRRVPQDRSQDDSSLIRCLCNDRSRNPARSAKCAAHGPARKVAASVAKSCFLIGFRGIGPS